VRNLPVWGALVLLLLLMARLAVEPRVQAPEEASASGRPERDPSLGGLAAQAAHAEALESHTPLGAARISEPSQRGPTDTPSAAGCEVVDPCAQEATRVTEPAEQESLIWLPGVLRDAPVEEPAPTPTPEPDDSPFRGEIIQTFDNCGLTHIFGVVHDAQGSPLTGIRVQVTWRAPDAQVYETTTGTYVRPETDESGWEIFLDLRPVANSWYVALIGADGERLSRELRVDTSGTCQPGDANAVKVRFFAVP
jgi:hypothetical protein